MRLSKYITEERQTGSLNYLYGGMPEVGGYGAGTEFEIGLARYCEAAHCILGSIVKSAFTDHFWIEKEHIHEEIGIMEYCIKEYSRNLYLDRLDTGLEEKNKYALKTLESLKKNSPKLAKLAANMKSNISKDTRPDIKEVAELCYDCIKLVAVLSVPVKDTVLSNPLASRGCSELTKKLRDAIKKLDWGEME